MLTVRSTSPFQLFDRLEQQLSQIGTILPGNTGNQSFFHFSPITIK
jgi:hypothetical protein